MSRSGVEMTYVKKKKCHKTMKNIYSELREKKANQNTFPARINHS